MTALSSDLVVTRAATLEPPASHLPTQAIASSTPASTPVPARSRLRHDVLPASLGLLGFALVAFLLQAGPLSWLEHARSQKVGYADLRRDLAAATVPTGQRDFNGRLVTPGTPLGYLSSSALGLGREVFFEGTTSAVLEHGPGHLRSSVLPGQPGIAVLYGRGSAYGGPFGKLGALRPGSVLTFTTGLGTSSYGVSGVRHAGDPFTGPAPGKGLLTLVSAEGHAFVPQRAVYVDAELVSNPMPVATPVLTSGNLAPSEAPLAGDPSAWPLLFLCVQGLAVAGLVLAWASRRFGGRQAWLVGAPVVGLLLVLSSQQALRLLPNVL